MYNEVFDTCTHYNKIILCRYLAAHNIFLEKTCNDSSDSESDFEDMEGNIYEFEHGGIFTNTILSDTLKSRSEYSFRYLFVINARYVVIFCKISLLNI